jgi:hypothetical protein
MALLLYLFTAAALTAEADSLKSLPDYEFLPVTNRAFPVGEKLTFGIYYQFIRVGTAVMTVEDTVLINGHPAIQIRTKARSASFFDNFFKVRDEIHSYVDVRYYHSLKFEKRLREGSYYHDLNLLYDYDKGKLFGESIRYEPENINKIKEQKKFEAELNRGLFDVLASFYYVRLSSIEPGMPISIASNDNEKVYPIIVFVQKKEKVEVDAGKFRTIMVLPKLKTEALFKQRGNILIWLTDDRYKIPVKVESSLSFGSIYIYLEKIEGHQLPLPSQLK